MPRTRRGVGYDPNQIGLRPLTRAGLN